MKATATNVPYLRPASEATASHLFVPLRPRFLHELVAVPCKEEFIIEGTERLQAVNIAAPDSVVPKLIGLMNGKRTLQELQSALPAVPEEDLLESISSLYQWGLVEDGAADSESEYSNVETLSFLRRYVGVTRSNRSGGEAYDRLQKSEVLVFYSDSDLKGATCLEALLVKAGIGRVVPLKRTLLSESCPRASISVAQSIAVSISFSGEDGEWHRKLDNWCFERRLPWLRIVLSPEENYADFGPLFFAERTACYRCFQEVHSITRGSGRVLSENEAGVEAHFWIGMAAAEIIYFLSRISPLATERYVERYDLLQQTSRRFGLLRVPGCLRCRPLAQEQVTANGDAHAINAIDSAVVFEDYISLASRPRTPFTIQEDYARISSSLARQVKRMLNSTHIQLPRTFSGLDRGALEILRQPAHARQQAITLADLSTMLMATAGIRDLEPGEQMVKRWTATAGNLGSVELFLVVRHIDGLAPGIYFYESHGHCLGFFQQRGATSTIPEIMQRVAVTDRPDLPDVLVCFTGAYHRLEKKYHEFAYKLVNLDAGVAVSQLHLIAKSLGLFSSTAMRWADDLIEQQLNLDIYQEHVTAVVALYASSSTQVTAARTSDAAIPRIQPTVAATRISDFCGLELREVTERLYWESRMNEHDLRSGPGKCCSAYGTPQRPLPLLQLPPPEERDGLTVNDILTQRTTVRNYAMDSVTPDQLVTILDCAHQGDLEQWREEHLAQPLTFYVLAWRLARFTPGVYAYNAGSHGLQFVAPARSVHDSMDLFVQPEFASAPVIIWITGNLAAACARLGALGHRLLLLRAGFAGHRLWTAASAMGLSGGITAGVVSGAAREQFGLDGYQRASLLAFASGVKEGYDQESGGTGT
jgi:SagB-type dehydrogenase family enzyme